MSLTRKDWAFQDQTTTGEQWATDKIRPYDKNAKIHSKEQIDQLVSIMKETGVRTRIIIDEFGEIIAGHGRFEAMKKLGFESVPVDVIKDLSDEQIRALRLVDNRVSSTDYDFDMLSEELRELHQDLDFDMSTYFSEKEMSFSIDDLAALGENALSDNLAGEVEAKSKETARLVEEADNLETPVTKVLGFSTVNAQQKRKIALLLAHMESETGLVGAAAMSVYASEFVGL